MNLSSTLYIIGNGFDLHHGIPSDYRDFGRFLKAVDPDTYREVETYFSVNDSFWWEFEAQLANFDIDAVIDYASQFLMSYGAEDWSDSGHHDYQYELNRVVEIICATMRERFAEWIRQLPIPEAASVGVGLLCLDSNARYLNFNYTQTLQRTYRIPDSQILHIHGSSSNQTDRLILGHGWQRTPADSLNHDLNMEEADTRVVEGNQIVDEYFSKTFKPTDQIIKNQQAFFRDLKSVQRIYVMGHSLSDVDAPYLDEILENIDASSVTWQISYHSDPREAQERFSRLGVRMALANFARLADIDQWRA